MDKFDGWLKEYGWHLTKEAGDDKEMQVTAKWLKEELKNWKAYLWKAYDAGRQEIIKDLEENFSTDLEEGFSKEGWEEYKKQLFSSVERKDDLQRG